MNKVLLAQALKFKEAIPTNGQINTLIKEVMTYQKEHDIYFLSIKHRNRPEIINMVSFFDFLSFISGIEITSFEDIEHLLSQTQSRKESIEKTGDSKEYYAKVFNKVVLFQKLGGFPTLYQELNDIPFDSNMLTLVVENGENFLNVSKVMSEYGFEQFIYLSGFPNILTKKFLEDKEAVFFLDYDIEAIRIYDSLTCKTKKFFKHPDVEKYFCNKKTSNQKLYKKQRARLPDKHDELQWLINLIKENSCVVEQEIFN